MPQFTLLSKIGSFDIDTTKTAGQTQTISGIEFQPKIVLFWWGGGYTTAGETVSSGTSNFGFGAGIAGNQNRLALNSYYVNNYSTGRTLTTLYYNESIINYASDAINYGWLDFYNMTSSGFTVIYDSPFRNTGKINYLALGGSDLTNAYIGYGTLPTATGYFTVTNSAINFIPDAVIFVSNYYNLYNSSDNTARGSIGWATSSGNQININYYDLNAADPTNSVGRGYNENLATYIRTAGDIPSRISFVEFIPSGFRAFQHVAGNTDKYGYIVFKGGRYKTGGITVASGIGEIQETIGFEPKTILFLSANRPLSSGITDNTSLSLGATSWIDNRAVTVIWSEDNLPTSEISFARYTDNIYANVKHNSLVGKADIKSITDSGFVIDYEDVNNNWISYLAFGETNLSKWSSKSAYVKGLITDSKHCYIYGHDPNGSEIRAYIHGMIIDYRGSKSAYVKGSTNTTSSKSSYVNYKPQSLATEIGFFNTDPTKTAGQTQSISGLGFQPKVVLFWWTGLTSDVGEQIYANNFDINVGFGAAKDSTHRFCVVGYSQDNVGISNTYRSQNNTEIVRLYRYSGGSLFVDGILDFSSMDSSGFTVTIDDQFIYPYKIAYMAVGGNDLTNVYIGNVALPTSSGTNLNVTDIGFQPDCVILTTQGQSLATQENDGSSVSYGWATNGKQGVISIFSKDGVDITYGAKYARDDEIYAYIGSTGTIEERGSFVEFIPSGFTLAHLKGTTANLLNYVALKGGQYYVGRTHSIFDVNAVSSGVGFKPNAALFLSNVEEIRPVDSPHNWDAELTVGLSTTSSNASGIGIPKQFATNTYDGNNVTTSNIWSIYTNNAVYFDGDYWGIAQLKSYNNDGLTIGLYDSSSYSYDGYYITFLAMGNALPRSNISAYIEGNVVNTSSKSAFVEGTDTNARQSKSAYINGKSIGISNKTSYINGSYGFNISQIYLSFYELISVTSYIHSFIYGSINTNSSKSCYILGQITNSKHAFIEGYSPNESVKHAYIRGTIGEFGPKVWIS